MTHGGFVPYHLPDHCPDTVNIGRAEIDGILEDELFDHSPSGLARAEHLEIVLSQPVIPVFGAVLELQSRQQESLQVWKEDLFRGGDGWCCGNGEEVGDALLVMTRACARNAKLADFGLAKIIGEESFTTTLCGTPSYVAPEILENSNHRRYTKGVDVWSLGVVLARLLCGLPKQEIDNTEVEWCKSIRERVKRALRQGHRQGQRRDLLSFVLEAMLCLDPDDRTIPWHPAELSGSC